MEEGIKHNEELKIEIKKTLESLREKLNSLIHNGYYELQNITRDYYTQKVTGGTMMIDDIKISLSNDDHRCGVYLPIPYMQINQTLLDLWDYQSIDNDVEYYEQKLAELKKKRDLMSANLYNFPAESLDLTGIPKAKFNNFCNWKSLYSVGDFIQAIPDRISFLKYRNQGVVTADAIQEALKKQYNIDWN